MCDQSISGTRNDPSRHDVGALLQPCWRDACVKQFRGAYSASHERFWNQPLRWTVSTSVRLSLHGAVAAVYELGAYFSAPAHRSNQRDLRIARVGGIAARSQDRTRRVNDPGNGQWSAACLASSLDAFAPSSCCTLPSEGHAFRHHSQLFYPLVTPSEAARAFKTLPERSDPLSLVQRGCLPLAYC